ncbi:hypothetical protein KR054_004786, partial [Drosophila jambulina]
ESQLKSSSTRMHFQKHHNLKDVTQGDARKVVHTIVDSMFQTMCGACNASDSECSVNHALQESLSMDRRLKHWYNTLQDRAAVQAKIARQVGRRPDEMLINLPATVASRDRGTVERLLDLAGRMNPTVMVRRQPAVLPGHPVRDEQECQCLPADPVCGEQQCTCLPDLLETLPRAERRGKGTMEVSGLPHVTKGEIMGRNLEAPDNRAQWLQSKVLDARIEQQDDNIKRVLEFYPDVDSLEVVGAGYLEGASPVPQIERVPAESMVSVSDTTEGSEEMDQDEDVPPLPHPNPELHASIVGRPSIKINGVLFHAGNRCASSEVGHTYFECHPYENVVKEVLVMENVGCQMFTFQWVATEPFRRANKTQMLQMDYFLISRTMFVVFPGEKYVCRALFRPRGCALVKLRLELRVYPHILGSRSHLVLQLTGKCVPPPEYTAKLHRQLASVLDKSKQRLTKDLVQLQASLVPLLQPHEVVCPYERVFDEREVFNAENPGYHCERFDDLEALKALHHELKKPREPAWDLRLPTILSVILRQPTADQRRIHYERFIEIQESMRSGVDTSRPFPFGRNEERDRSRFIYVRGCIGNGIQEWEGMMASLELSALRSEVIRYNARQRDLEEEDGYDGEEDPEPKPWMRQLRLENTTLYLLKKMRSRKPYRDALYMHTYSHLCDVAEDVVSIIESTQYV